MRRLIDNGNRPITPKPHIGAFAEMVKEIKTNINSKR